MKLTRTALPDVLIIEPKVFSDERGFFLESYNRRAFREATGLEVEFVQDNHSRSRKNVLRGLHYQIQRTQGKLVWAVVGEIYDVAVDLRRSSPTFGRWAGFRLSSESRQMAWIPAGFAHGFLAMSEVAEVLYKTTDYYAQEHERTLIWNDPDLGIDWPVESGRAPLLAPKDRNGKPFKSTDLFA